MTLGEKMSFIKIREENSIDNQFLIQEFKEDLTGMVHVHIKKYEQTNEENAMSFYFNTLPDNSKGVAHILEHCVLAGSEKYPLKDPFFMLSRNSMNTFMNAMTGPDSTIYLFGSKLEKDFKNIMSIYQDAIFFPLLRKTTFTQEGFRLQLDEKNQLSFQGVVYNEMKGAYSQSAQSRDIFKALTDNLVPDSIYNHSSGGHPQDIPFVTHQEMVNFHGKYYQPSNCKVVTFGSVQAEYYHEQLQEVINQLKENNKLSFKSYHEESLFIKDTKENHDIVHFDFSAEEKQKKQIFLAYFSDNKENSIKKDIEKNILLKYLLDDHNSFLSKRINQDFEDGVIGPYNFTYDLRKKDIIIINIQQIESEEEKNMSYLIKLIDDMGYDYEHDHKKLESLINNMELSMRRKNYGTKGEGVSILLKADNILLQEGGGFIFDILNKRKILEEVREEAFNDKKYIQKLVKKYLNKSHCLKMIGQPNLELKNANTLKEKEYIDILQKELTLEKINKIHQINEDMKMHQNQKEDISILPQLKIEDIQFQKERRDLIIKDNKYFAKTNTNGINTLSYMVQLPEMNNEEKALYNILPHINHFFGTERFTSNEIGDVLSQKGLKLTHSNSFYSQNKKSTYQAYLVATIEFLDSSKDDVTRYIPEILLNQNFFDKEKMEIAIDGFKNDWIQSQEDIFHSMIKNAVKINDVSSLYDYQLNNHRVIELTNSLLQEDQDILMKKFQSLFNKIYRSENITKILFVGEKDGMEIMEDFEKKCKEFKPLVEKNGSFLLNKEELVKKIVVSDSQVNYVYYHIPFQKGLDTIRYHQMELEEKAAIQVLTSLINNQYAHPMIREKGGAYGGSAYFCSTGVMLSSYRDPHLQQTIEVCADMNQWFETIKKTDFFEEYFNEAKINTIKKVDPLSNDIMLFNNAFMMQQQDVNIEDLWNIKEFIKNMTIEKVLEVFDKYIKDGMLRAEKAAFISLHEYEKSKQYIHEHFDSNEIIDISSKNIQKAMKKQR